MIGTTKKISWIRTVQFVLVLAFLPSTIFADQTLKKFRTNFKSVLMADADTGRILFAEHEHRKVYPASIVKLMSVLLTFEAIEAGKISLDNAFIYSFLISRFYSYFYHVLEQNESQCKPQHVEAGKFGIRSNQTHLIVINVTAK